MQETGTEVMKAVAVGAAGALEVVERPLPSPQGREVAIRVLATALNRADLLQAKGLYPPPPGATDILGLECVGTVVARGPECTSDLAVGDRVMALLAGGGYAQQVVADERQVMRALDAHSDAQAAAIPQAWLTAFQLLRLEGKAKAGDSVLIHAGASGVGTAAVQLARLFGLKEVMVTAGSAEKLELAQSLGASRGFNYKDGSDWADGVLAATDGRGVDLVLDCVGHPYVAQHLRALALDGRWVLFGMMGGVPEARPELFGGLLRKRLTLVGTLLRTRSVEYKGELVEQFWATTREAFAAGKLSAVLDARSFQGLESVAEAHAYLESNASTGKVIVKL